MPKADKDVAGQIVDFLRIQNDKVIVSLRGITRQFGCSCSSVAYSIGALKRAGIVMVGEKRRIGKTKLFELALSDQFKEGDSWQKALKRKSRKEKAKAEPGIDAKLTGAPERPTLTEAASGKCQSEECLRARMALLGELVEVFNKLKATQEENGALYSAIAELKEKVNKLEKEVEKRVGTCQQLRTGVEKLESQVRTLRAQTSQPSSQPPRTLKFDGSGAMILPGEGRPDRS